MKVASNTAKDCNTDLFYPIFSHIVIGPTHGFDGDLLVRIISMPRALQW